MEKVIPFVNKSESALSWTPKDALKSALEEIKDENSIFSTANKIIIIALDDNNGIYNTRYIQAGMKSSECLALCEITKTALKQNILGYR
jgi:hypothetical protein